MVRFDVGAYTLARAIEHETYERRRRAATALVEIGLIATAEAEPGRVSVVYFPKVDRTGGNACDKDAYHAHHPVVRWYECS